MWLLQLHAGEVRGAVSPNKRDSARLTGYSESETNCQR